MSLLRKRNTGCHGEMFDTNATFYGLVNVVGNLVVTGNEFIGGALDAVGAVNFFSTLDVADTINAGANLGVTGDAFIGTNLDVTGTSRLRDTLQVEGAATLDASLGVFGASVLQSTLAVTGAGTFDDTLDVTGEATTGSLGVTGAGTVGGTFGVIGATTLFSTLGVTGAGTFDDTLDVTGAATTGSLGVTGAGTVGGTFGVIGATTLFSTLGVAGKATLQGALDVDGIAEFKNTSGLAISALGVSSFEGAVNMTGVVTGSNVWNLRGSVFIGLPPPAPQTNMTQYGTYTLNGSFGQAGPTAVTHNVDVTGAVSLDGDTSATLRSDSSVSVNSLGSATLLGDTSTTIGSVTGGETIVTGLITTVTSPDGPVTVAAVDDVLNLNGLETNLTATTAMTIDCPDIDIPTASFYILTDIAIGYEFTPFGCYTGVLPWVGPWAPLIPPADVPAGGSVDDGFGYYDDGTNTETGQGSLRVHRGAGFTDVMLYGDNFVDLAVQSSEPTGQDGRFYIDDGSNASSSLPSLRYYADSQWFSAAPYVQGSFTPVLRVGGTSESLQDADGYYMRIGNMVTVAVHIVWTTTTSTGSLTVSIPFNTIGTAAISTYAIQGGQFQNISVGGGAPLTEAFQFALRRTTGNSDRFNLVYFEPTRPVDGYQNNVSNLTDVNLNSGTKVIGFSISYLATPVTFP